VASHIIFGSLQAGKEFSGERVRVVEDAKAVVDALGSSQNGYAEFTQSGKNQTKVWVNAGQVRAVRDAN
jgi:hypothetical protein